MHSHVLLPSCDLVLHTNTTSAKPKSHKIGPQEDLPNQSHTKLAFKKTGNGNEESAMTVVSVCYGPKGSSTDGLPSLFLSPQASSLQLVESGH